MVVNHNVPYFNQSDNMIDPSGSSGVTSVAMCLKYFNVPDPGPLSQYEDDIRKRSDELGLDHHSPDGIRRLLESFGLRDDITLTGSISDITYALDSSEICILHAFLTSSGHIFVIRGYNDNGDFFVNDPAGEWSYTGYCRNSNFDPDNKGENRVYSRKLISAAGNAFSLRQTLDFYDTWDSHRIESTATMWLHRISK